MPRYSKKRSSRRSTKRRRLGSSIGVKDVIQGAKLTQDAWNSGKSMYKAYIAWKQKGANNRANMTKAATFRKNTTRTRRIRRGTPFTAVSNSATIRNSSGLKIGSYRPLSFPQKIEAIMHPPITFDSKWTFQMDCTSGFVSAAQIPILTEELISPIRDQLYANATSDAQGDGMNDPAFQGMTTHAEFSKNYQIMINYYKSSIRLYNSSTNTLRCRLVWYRPARDLDSEYQGNGAFSNEPINMLMQSQNAAGSSVYTSPFPSTVGDGCTFNNSTAGADYTANYNHCGWPIVGSQTTKSHTENTIAILDSKVVPGNANVRRMFSHFWTTLKEQDFTIEPGNQVNTSVTLKNRIMRSNFEDTDVYYKKDCCVIGVIYVIGQVVFSGQEGISTITTGSSQLAVMRTDTCSMRPMRVKKPTRINLTEAFQSIDEEDQNIINTDTGNEKPTYEFDQ